MLIKKVSADCEDARNLCEELSNTLETITGNGGKASFDVNDMKNERSIFAVSYIDGKPCGCGAVKEISKDCGEVKRVYAKLKGKGIGSAVLLFLESESKKLGYTKLLLETRKVNENAVNFYLKHKYIICDNYGKYKDRDNAVCFSKEL